VTWTVDLSPSLDPYYFALTAYDVAGNESSFSTPEINYTVAESHVGPAFILFSTNTTLTFQWDANTEEDLKDYRFYVRIEGTEFTEPIAIITAPSTSYTWTSQQAGAYSFAVTARNNEDEESNFSNIVIRTIE